MKHLHHHRLLLLSCIPLLLCAVVPVATGGRHEAQALLKWKATLASGRESLSSWSLAVNSTSPCNWMFVICNSAGDVIKLLISEASLNGTLAGLDFSAFPHLEVLDMESNDLYGSIPEGIGNLTSLTSLRIMYDPHLTGEIPRNIGKLKQLVELQLQSLGLNGAIPPEIGNLTSLEELSLGGNSLTGSIPPTIGNMTELHVMDLGQNHLDGELPSTLSHLVKLKSLSVSNNQLEGHITTQLGDKSNLVWIDISGNNFSGTFPQSICTGALQNFLARRNGFANLHLHDLNFQNCTSLEVLDFAANNILGDLSEWLGTLPKLPNLRILKLEENKITGEIPPTLGNMTSLTDLNLGHNLLTGTIPSELGKLVEIYSLNLSYNNLLGPLPPTMRNLSHLTSLDLSSCSFTGPAYDLLISDHSIFPSNFSFPDIQVLALSSNNITGTIPMLLCNATLLTILDLSNNALYGDLPDCLWDLPTIVFMDLSSNSLSGVVPFSRSSNSTLQSLHLANNHFKGSFPAIIKKCDHLITLDLGNNYFTGEIPSWIAESLPQLRFLRLSSNMFDGIIPKQVLQFRQLQLLDLSDNKLTGPIPDDFANFTGMTQGQEHVEITYYDNAYSDQIQLVWKNRNYVYNKTIRFIVGIDLSCNSISQMIPEGLTTLRGLKYLNLSRNNLSGDIPKDIGNLALLESLDLSSNKLKGEIPPSFADLKSITTLNLSHNGLSGRIPTGRQLQTLDPSTYSNNPGLCGFPLKECADATSSQTEMSQDDDREALLLYCFGVAGFIFGFWLSWGIVFCNETWRCALYQYVDNMQEKVAKIAAYRCSRPRP